MIFRTIHDKDNPYFPLSRDAVNDERLSFKAIGIHTYLMSKPDGWEANTGDLVARHPDGMAAVRSGIEELIQYGYIKRRRVVNEFGQVVRWTMDVYETSQLAITPECENQIVVNPECENRTPECGFPQVGNRTLVINEYRENKYIAADAAPHTDSDSEKQVDSPPSVVAKEKPVRKSAKKKEKKDAPPVDEAPKLPTEHQQMFEKICQIVGWDWKTIGEKEKGQVAQTLGILKRADYTLDELNRFGREVWVKDWRWEKYKQYPTLSLLRSEIGKLRQTEQQKEELRTPTDGISWKKVFEEQKTKFAEYEWSPVT